MQTAVQPYRERGADSSVMVHGRLTSNFASYTLALSVGADRIAAGDLNMSGTGVLVGDWKGKPVMSDCTGSMAFWSGQTTIKCHITIAGEHAASLSFTPDY